MSKRLFAEMCGQPQISYERLKAILGELRSIDGLTDELYAAIEESFKNREWRCLNLLISIIHWNPDRRFTPILCELLDHHATNINVEDIADTLDYLEDERAVPALIRAVEPE